MHYVTVILTSYLTKWTRTTLQCNTERFSISVHCVIVILTSYMT